MLLLLTSLLFLPFIFADCPAGTIQYPFVPPSKCYSFNTAKATFDTAEQSCNKAGGNLASIHDAFTNSFLKEEATLLFRDSATADFWIGAKRLNNNTNWFWTDNSKFDFSDWQNSDIGKNYGVMSTINGLWNTADSTVSKPYVCETDAPLISTTTAKPISTTKAASNCSSEDWYYFEETNSCYYFTDKFVWGKAEEYCVSQNAHLSSIHSYTEFYFVQTIFNGDLWIGLYANYTPVNLNTTWKWTDGSPVDYLLWFYPFIPSFNDWQCVKFHSDGKNNPGFTNTNCTEKNYAVCKKPAATIFTTSAPVTTTTEQAGPCLTGWMYNNVTNYCYIQTPMNINWTTAEQYCAYNGAHLASIHSLDELKYISGINSYYDFIWIGLHSDDNGVVWKWTDNTPFDYRNWLVNNPTRGGNLCTFIWDFLAAVNDGYGYGFSNSKDCNLLKHGYCKKPVLQIRMYI
jgi:hypothetical protein